MLVLSCHVFLDGLQSHISGLFEGLEIAAAERFEKQGPLDTPALVACYYPSEQYASINKPSQPMSTPDSKTIGLSNWGPILLGNQGF